MRKEKIISKLRITYQIKHPRRSQGREFTLKKMTPGAWEAHLDEEENDKGVTMARERKIVLQVQEERCNTDRMPTPDFFFFFGNEKERNIKRKNFLH